jgi:hypothetical protein
MSALHTVLLRVGEDVSPQDISDTLLEIGVEVVEYHEENFVSDDDVNFEELPAVREANPPARACARRERPTIGRVLASELERDLERARVELQRSLARRPEHRGPRVDVLDLVAAEVVRRERGMGSLPPIPLTYVGRRPSGRRA